MKFIMKRVSNHFLCLIAFCLFVSDVFAQVTVRQDGKGDFKTIQEAVNSIPDYNQKEAVIFIKKGVYKEKLTIPAAKINITLMGEDSASTIITHDDYASKLNPEGKGFGTSGSASVRLEAANFKAYNLTFANSSGPVGQAVAVWSGGNRSYFKKCRFIGFQDTLYTYGAGFLQLFEDCYIDGTVDFIFGSATAWFEKCTIFCKTGGYVTAASTPDSVKYGYVFNRCRVIGNAKNASFSLGRPWRPFAKTLFMESYLGEIIKPEGWSVWTNKDDLSTTIYAEYHNHGPGAAPEKRLSWTKQLSDKEAKAFSRLNVLKGWNPVVKN